MSVIGFDIGNENSVVATARRGVIDVFLNNEAKSESPAVLSFGDKQRFLGSAGAAFATANPKSTTISQIKRLIGRRYNEPSVQEDLKSLPFVTSEGPRGGIMIELEYLKKKWKLAPVEILGMLLKHLKQIAEENLESVVVDCVIGIPSYFTDLQRREYLDAATIAGLRPLSLMHDGTAIALGYGYSKTDLLDSGSTNVIFVDIGHCDTQVTIAAFKLGKMDILSHSFDQNLGGRDFDEVLFKHFAAQFSEQYKIDVYSNARASLRLRASCEKLKKVLSANKEATLSIKCLVEDTDVRGILTRNEFERLSSDLLQRVTTPCRKALKDSGLSVDKIYAIELVGSGSRIPAITKSLTSLFQKEPTRTLNARECVVRGCALLCAMLSPTLVVRDYEVKDLFPYSIALTKPENQGRQEIELFPQDSLFPDTKNLIRHDGSTSFSFQVSYTNMKDLPAGVSPLVGHFKIGQHETSDSEKLDVKFVVRLNHHGIFEIKSASVSATDKNVLLYPPKLVTNSRILKFSENLDVSTTKDELLEAQGREQIFTEQDKKTEQIKDQRNTVETFVYDTRVKLKSAYKRVATDIENEKITISLQETEEWLYEDGDDKFDEQDYARKLEDLKKLLEPVENRYQDEYYKAQTKKPLLAMIEEYRSVANSLPLENKMELLKECEQVEQYLSGHPPEHYDPIVWSDFIKEIMDRFKSRCASAMQEKSALAEQPEPMDTDPSCNHMESQTGNPVEARQTGKYMDGNQRDKPVEWNQASNPMKQDQTRKPVKRDQESKPLKTDQTSKPVNMDQPDKPFDSE